MLAKMAKIEEVKRRNCKKKPDEKRSGEGRFFYLPKNNIDVQVSRSLLKIL